MTNHMFRIFEQIITICLATLFTVALFSPGTSSCHIVHDRYLVSTGLYLQRRLGGVAKKMSLVASLVNGVSRMQYNQLSWCIDFQERSIIV